MRLEFLELGNYRCFSHLRIDFDAQLTVLVGVNGSGKTAILDAAAVAFGPYLGAFDKGKSSGFFVEDTRLKRVRASTAEMEPQFPITLNAGGWHDGQSYLWNRQLLSEKSKTTIAAAKDLAELGKNLQEEVRTHGNVILPLLAYYGTGRLWKENRLTELRKSVLSESRTIGYRDCMNPSSSYKEFAYWLKQIILADLQEKLQWADKGKRTEKSELSALISAVQNAVNQPLRTTGWHTIRYDAKTDQVVAEHEEKGILPVSLLSDGVRNILALAADIAFRCCKLNPHLGSEAVAKTPGIVLIDELDMHLHPGWQQKIVTAFQKAFPAVQFILTTHSPHLISTVASEKLRILDQGKVFSAAPGTKGADASRILKRIFEVHPRPKDDPNAILLSEYLSLVYGDQWDSGAAVEKRKRLDEIFQGEEPALTEADLYIENRKWEMADEADLQV